MGPAQKIFRRFGLLVLLALSPVARAVTMIYPVDAIDDLWHLAAEEFRQKYGGINVSGIGPSDEGWYVRYRHENLTYLFGPLADREEARKKKWEMETIRDAAVRNRANLSTSQVDFVRFTYSGVYGKAGDSPYSGAGSARISQDGKSGPDGDLDGDGIPNSKDDDMDGDGIPNARDGDVDGDGIPNGADNYAFGTDPGPDGKGLAGDAKNGTGQDKNGGDKGNGGTGDEADGTKGGKGDRLGQKSGGQNGDGAGGEAGQAGQAGSQGQQGRQVASNQRSGQNGRQQGSQGGQQGQSGQSGQQGQQGQQSSQQGGQSGSSGQSSGQPGSPSPMGGEGGGGGNPLQILSTLLRMILGI
jgi:hypothetical protein